LYAKTAHPHRGDPDGFLLQVELLDNFGYDFVDNTVRAAGAIMHVVVVHDFRLGVNQVFGANYTVYVHNPIFLKICTKNNKQRRKPL
jgi:hypothetical protein